jgi:thiamine-phosphate pyrophosphorylase
MRFEGAGIYPVITPEYCKGRSPLEVLESTLKGGAKIVQLRDKKDPERYAADFRKITSKYNVLLIINDSIDLALKYMADGVHLGKSDLPVAEARKKTSDLIIGASVENLDQALKAEEDGASYITIGPIFNTGTKKDIGVPVGIEVIRQIIPKVKIPVSAIGGINKSNIQLVIDAGVKQIAMITAITEAEDVEKATREMIELVIVE